MEATEAPERTMRNLAVAGGFLALHLVPILWEGPISFWGVDFLRYGDLWPVCLFGILAVSLLVPRTGDLVLNGCRKIGFDPWKNRRSGAITVAALVVAGIGMFSSFTSAVHLLGDGYLYVRELESASQEALARSDRAPLTFWLMKQVHWIGKGLWGTAETTYRVMSIVAGGLFIGMAFVLSGRLGANRLARSLILVLLLTGGYVQVFFGYVENYALLFPGMLVYILLGYRALQGELSPIFPAIALGFLTAIHFSMISFAPSLMVVLWPRQREQMTGHMGSRWGQALLPMLAASGTFFVALLLIGVSPFSLLDLAGRSHLLPLFKDSNFYQPYGMFSTGHLLDLLNQFLLSSPGAILVLAMVGFRIDKSDSTNTFLLVVAGAPLLLVVLVNPEIGAFRDWDVLSIPALPLTVWAAYQLITREGNRGRLVRTGYVICMAALLHLCGWVYTNSDAERAHSRFEDLLEASTLSKHAGSYGWETLGIYYREQGDSQKALNAYQAALQSDPANPRHWFAVGTLLFNQGKKAASVSSFKKAISLRPDMAEVHSNLGNVLTDLGRTREAEIHFERAIALEPGFADAHSNYGNLFARQGRFPEAKEAFNRALALQPEVGDVYFNLANTHLALKEFEEALTYYKKAIALDPGFEGAYLNLGNTLYDLGRYSEAVQAFQSVIRIEPGSPEARFGIGNCLMGQQRPEEALRHFEEAVKHRPEFVEAHSLAGDVHFMQGRFDQAARSYERAISLNTDFVEGHANLGNVYHALGRNEEAIQHLSKAIELKPDFVEAHYNLAVVFLKMNRIAETRRAFRKVLVLAPDHREAASIRGWLAAVR